MNHYERIKSSLLTVDQSITNKLHQLLSSQIIINWSWRKLWWLNKVFSEECQDRPTPWSFSANVEVDPTPISLLRRKSRTPNFSQTSFNRSLRKTAAMREMKSSPVLCDLIYCPRVWISHPLNRCNYWAVIDTGESTLQLISSSPPHHVYNPLCILCIL